MLIKYSPLWEQVTLPLLTSQAELPIYMLPLSVHQNIFPANSVPFKSYLVRLFFLSNYIALHLLNLTFFSLALTYRFCPEPICSSCVFSYLYASELAQNSQELSSEYLDLDVDKYEDTVSKYHLKDPFFRHVYLEDPYFL